MSASLSGTPRDRSSVSNPADTSRSSSSKPSASSARTRPRASCASRTSPTTIIPMASPFVEGWSQLAYPTLKPEWMESVRDGDTAPDVSAACELREHELRDVGARDGRQAVDCLDTLAGAVLAGARPAGARPIGEHGGIDDRPVECAGAHGGLAAGLVGKDG